MPEETTTPHTPPTFSFSLQEVSLMYNVLAACAKRGAFGIEEFKDISALYETLKTHLEPHIKSEDKK